jgi:hypothetical protein
MKGLLLLLPLIAVSLSAQTPFIPGSAVLVRAHCDHPISSKVVASLKHAIIDSGKYRLTGNPEDDGKLDLVHTIYVTSDENGDFAAVATEYGIAQCHGTHECGSADDGASLNASLCQAKQAMACGYALFKVFDYYVGLGRPLKIDF